MKYNDRKDAALKLMPYLEKYRNEQVVILAVPRGGVPIGYYISKRYNFPLDLLMTKKIGYPNNPEFAIGAVSLEDFIVDEKINVPKTYINENIKQIRNNLEKRYHLFMGNRKPNDLRNKTVIIVDDGIATGNTILSSIKMLRKKKVKKIVVAVPVSPPESANFIKKEVDDFICPYLPEIFVGVGLHYIDFSEVTDEEVIRFLNDSNHFEKNRSVKLLNELS